MILENSFIFYFLLNNAINSRIFINTIQKWVIIIFKTKIFNIFKEIWSSNDWF